ncbi:hypothetical protein MMC22_006467 [Lobaria immixta]|nr:hypothetical protein [Lobaria immixta]
MAAPNIHNLTAIGPLQEAILGNLNIRDFINANTAGIVNLNLQPVVVRRYLRARCDESTEVTDQQGNLTRHPCTNGPLQPVTMRWCDKPLPTWHGGPMNHNVCLRCLHNAFFPREIVIRNNLEQRCSIQCKRCSQTQRRLHPDPGPHPYQTPYQTCDCMEHIQAGWKCKRCFDDVMDTRFAVGEWRSGRLLRCHKVTDKRTKRKKIVYKDPPRVREACATPNCGAAPWTIPGFRRAPGQKISHPEATYMCLNCNGIWIFPVGQYNRP